MDNWKMTRVIDRPDPVGRELSIMKEVTPCSEYTRYSAEGRMKDPHSNFSVILGSFLAGYLFKLGPFEKKKWSEKLGYGMCVLGEDTRIHFHTNGKFVIRRALDQDHANNLQKVLSQLSRPALYSTKNRSFMWEIIRDLAILEDPVGPKDEEKLFPWPEGEGYSFDMEEAILSFRLADESFSSVIEELFDQKEDVKIDEISNGSSLLVEEFSNALKDLLDGKTNNTGKILGWGSYILLVLTTFRNRSE